MSQGWTSYEDDLPRGWPIAETGVAGQAPDLPERLILDLDTPLEQAMLGVAIVGGIGALFALFATLEDSSNFGYIVLGLLLGGLGLWLRSQVDTYYILDRPRKTVLFRRKFLGREEEIPVLTFDQLYALSIQGRFRQNKYSKWWEYALLLVGRQGRQIRVSDFFCNHEGFRRVQSAGQEAAANLGVPLIEGGPEKELKVRPGPAGEPVIEFSNRFPWEWLVGIAVFVVLMLVFFGLN